MNMDFQKWVEKHETLLLEVKKLIESFGLKVIIVKEKPSFLRLVIGKENINFHVKEIRNRFVRQVWLCKKERFNNKNYYIIHLEKENRWIVGSGQEIDRNHEIRKSDEYKGEYIVVSLDIFHPAKMFFKSVRNRLDQMKQQRLNQYQ